MQQTPKILNRILTIHAVCLTSIFPVTAELMRAVRYSLGLSITVSTLAASATVDQHAFQSTNHNDRQDHVLIFVCLELAAQPFSGFPDLVSEVV